MKLILIHTILTGILGYIYDTVGPFVSDFDQVTWKNDHPCVMVPDFFHSLAVIKLLKQAW